MKQLNIVVRKEKLDAVKQIVLNYSAGGMTVYDVSGCGTYEEPPDTEGLVFSPDMKRDVHLTSKVRFDVVVNDDEVEILIDKVCEAALTGRCGDGKIFVSPIETAVRIRTKERDGEAI